MNGLILLLADAASSQPAVSWHDLLVFHWKDWGIELRVGLLGLILLMVAAVAACGLRRRLRSPGAMSFETTAIKIKYGDLVEQEIKPNHDTVRIAYQAWVEITTRKVGLPYEEEHDVVVEVYNSWYQVFGILRELAKSVPAHRLRECSDTRHLVDVLHKVLNDGLRPHLTQWQAKFRRWYDQARELPENRDKTPQDIQRQYPQYKDLITDLKRVNERFLEFAKTLRTLAEGEGKP